MDSASEANAKAVRLMYAAFNKGDDEGFFALAHDDVRVVGADEHGQPVEGAEFRGLDGLRRYLDGVRTVLREPSVEVVAINEGEDRVVATIVVHGKAAATGADIAVSAVHFFGFDDGKIRWLRTHRAPVGELKREGWRRYGV